MEPRSDPLRELNVESRFGFKKGELVKIIKGEAFCGQVQKVVGFTEALVIVTVSGPLGEPDSSWWFEPEELELWHPVYELN